MACFPRSDDDLPLVDNRTRLDALLAIGIASLEQMQRIQAGLVFGIAQCRLQARQHSGLIRVLRYDEAGVAVCFFLIGGAFPIIGK